MMKKIKRVIAVLLIVTITFNLLPENIVSAKNKEVKTQQGQTEETQYNQDVTQQTSEIKEIQLNHDTTQQTSVEQTTEKPYILSEIEEKREPNTKYFLMSDKSITAATYDQSVHTLVDGKYVDIDNSFDNKADDDKESILENKTNELKTKFAKKVNKNKLASLEYQGYKISWSMPEANKVSAQTIDNSNNKNAKKPTDLDEKLLLTNVSSKVTYNEILKNVNLNYLVKNQNLKENLILKNSNVNDKFVFNYDIGDLCYKIDENKNIQLYDKNNSSNIIYTIQKPFMFDSQKKYSEDIEMKVEENKKGITITRNF